MTFVELYSVDLTQYTFFPSVYYEKWLLCFEVLLLFCFLHHLSQELSNEAFSLNLWVCGLFFNWIPLKMSAESPSQIVSVSRSYFQSCEYLPSRSTVTVIVSDVPGWSMWRRRQRTVETRVTAVNNACSSKAMTWSAVSCILLNLCF